MKQRIVWLDSLKGFLILLVVVGHSIQEVGMHNFPGGEWIWYFIYSFHMMAFLRQVVFYFITNGQCQRIRSNFYFAENLHYLFLQPFCLFSVFFCFTSPINVIVYGKRYC